MHVPVAIAVSARTRVEAIVAPLPALIVLRADAALVLVAPVIVVRLPVAVAVPPLVHLR